METLHLGDCLNVLKTLPDNSVDAIVTDPPYGLKFMNKHWDYDVPSVDIWKEALRVLKPGGHLLSFGGTRTYHRMAVNIEDAGFEIRDQIQWIYGSGFPKSHNISKAIDKMAGAEREVVATIKKAHISQANTNEGWSRPSHLNADGTHKTTMDITAPATPKAKQWEGWGSSLKPANEPICLARKPLENGLTIAENVLKWGTGALNIDGSRIGTDKMGGQLIKQSYGDEAHFGGGEKRNKQVVATEATGRWPANVLFDEEAAQVLDEQTKYLHGAGFKRDAEFRPTSQNIEFKGAIGTNMQRFGDSGGASRFFYVAKASKRERNAGLEGMPEKERPLGISQWSGQTNGSGEVMGPSKPQQNSHPTVKPTKLMQYLIKLITPPSGIVLDPFMGSGSTGVAAKQLGFDFVGIELNEEYLEIAKKRIDAAQ